MKKNSSHSEHLRLCLQLILQAHLHELDVGFTEEKLHELCAQLRLTQLPDTNERRLAALQVLAAQRLPQMVF
jgi:hypothetical protein